MCHRYWKTFGNGDPKSLPDKAFQDGFFSNIKFIQNETELKDITTPKSTVALFTDDGKRKSNSTPTTYLKATKIKTTKTKSQQEKVATVTTDVITVSYTHLRAHETVLDIV